MKSKIGGIVFDLKESFEDLGYEIKNIQKKLEDMDKRLKVIETAVISENL